MVQIMLFQYLKSIWIIKVAIGCHLTFPKMDFHFTPLNLSVFLRQIEKFWLTLALKANEIILCHSSIHYHFSHWFNLFHFEVNSCRFLEKVALEILGLMFSRKTVSPCFCCVKRSLAEIDDWDWQPVRQSVTLSPLSERPFQAVCKQVEFFVSKVWFVFLDKWTNFEIRIITF